MIGASPRREDVGVLLVEPEQGPTVVQNDPCAGNHQSGPKGVKKALNQRYGVSLCVDRGEVYRIWMIVVGGFPKVGSRPGGINVCRQGGKFAFYVR